MGGDSYREQLCGAKIKQIARLFNTVASKLIQTIQVSNLYSYLAK